MNTFKNLGSVAAVAALLVLLVVPNTPEDQGYLRTLLAAAGFFKWIKIVTYLRGLQTLRLGQKFLPIHYTLQEGVSFLAVMVFFILAAWHALYALYPEEEVSWIGLFRQTYELGFLGEFAADNLLGKSANDGTSSWAWVQQITFLVAAMLVVVMLTNIYIGVMGNAYNHNHGKALELFVRARASICLDISLQYGGAWLAVCRNRNGPPLQGCLRDKGLRVSDPCLEGEGDLFHDEGRRGTASAFLDEHVWFCCADSNYNLGMRAEDTGTTSVHQMRELQKAVGRAQEMLQQLRHLPEQVHLLAEGQGINISPRPSSRPLTSQIVSPTSSRSVQKQD